MTRTPFYLLHCLVFFHAHRLIGPDALTPAGLAAASVLAALLLASAVFRWVEQPVRRWVVALARADRPRVRFRPTLRFPSSR